MGSSSGSKEAQQTRPVSPTPRRRTLPMAPRLLYACSPVPLRTIC